MILWSSSSNEEKSVNVCLFIKLLQRILRNINWFDKKGKSYQRNKGLLLSSLFMSVLINSIRAFLETSRGEFIRPWHFDRYYVIHSRRRCCSSSSQTEKKKIFVSRAGLNRMSEWFSGLLLLMILSLLSLGSPKKFSRRSSVGCRSVASSPPIIIIIVVSLTSYSCSSFFFFPNLNTVNRDSPLFES